MDKLKLELQLALEQQGLTMGKEREESRLERDLASGGTGSTIDKVLRENTRQVASAILQLQAEDYATFEASFTGGRGGTRLKYRRMMLQALDAETLAFLTVRAILTAMRRERTMASVSTRLAQSVEDTLWMTEVKDLEKVAAREREYAPRNRIPKLVSGLKRYPQALKKWKKRLEDLPTTEWTKVDRMDIGSALLGVAVPHLRDVVTVTESTERRKGRPQYMLTIKPSFIERLSEEAGRVAYMRPFYLPMVVPPVPWDNHGKGIKGGYYTLRAAGLKTHIARQGEATGHTQPDDVGDTHLAAMNKLQAVPMVVNGFVLENATRAFQSDLGPVPYKPEVEVPGRLSDEQWEALTREEQVNRKGIQARAHDHNFRQREAKLAHNRALSVAEMFKNEEAIYFPHAMDYRGRFYPIPQDLHPQGPDMVKSLLKLGESKPLGERGLVWLECHTANTYGLDKEDRLTQQMWTTANWDRIMLVGQDPWLDLEFWQGADEPWQFLAAAHEMYLAHSSDDPASYESNLVVSVDGSCNGLQHLSAMGLDEVGGSAVNLMEGDRQDIYQIVADKVNGMMPTDSVWVGKVTRKTVKRAVMTTPYGVTPTGIAEQLRKDGFTAGMENENAASQELKGYIQAALKGTVVKGIEIMQWFKDCCKILTKDGKGITWETPTGMVVSMMYVDPGDTRVWTPFGYLRVMKEITSESKLKTHKQDNGVAPNIIHSFDAAHLARVVLAFEGAVCAVHDSYGTHACDVDALLETTKEEFINIYSEDWFEKLRASIIFHSDRPAMPQAPERGNLDITQVRKSAYFFA